MEFRIADTFTASLGKLTGDEQKAVKTTAFDLQINPSSPGIRYHKLDRAKDKNFWSVSVNMDIRLIVHKDQGSLLLCYVDHHDKAYDWAERRKLEVHPKTGAAQLVEIRETVQEIFVPVYIHEDVPSKALPKLFEKLTDDELLGYGVPEEWLEDVKAATEDSLLVLADYLPAEAAEALLELATGGKPVIVQVTSIDSNPFTHPDAQRRFRTMHGIEELERALDFPWDKWTIFLHPSQRQLVERDYSGPAKVSGSAGTGKTIVALHRAVHLASSNEDARVLLTTFSPLLANALKGKLKRLIINEPTIGESIDVYRVNEVGVKLYKANIGTPQLISDNVLLGFLNDSAKEIEGHKFSTAFLLSEWEQVVDAWQLKTWEEYRDVRRLGRKTRLPENQRMVLWSIFEKVNDRIITAGVLTYSMLFTQLANLLSAKGIHPYTHVVVDEAQDISVAQLRFVTKLVGDDNNSLFFAGDSGQRIFQLPFSWKSVGVDIRGRAKTLNVNYRTSHQIRQQADRLLGTEVSDVDGNIEERDKTVSVFNGPKPQIETFAIEQDESDFVNIWINEQLKNKVVPHEIGIFVRSDNELERAINAVKGLDVPYKILDEKVETTFGSVAISTMHFAKGLEFKSVAVIACDDEVIPSQARIENITDNADLEEVYNTERHLLYVACTRAREFLLVTSVKPASEFLEDLVF